MNTFNPDDTADLLAAERADYAAADESVFVLEAARVAARFHATNGRPAPAPVTLIPTTGEPTTGARWELVAATFDLIADTLLDEHAAIGQAIAEAALADDSADDHQFPAELDRLRYAAHRAEAALATIGATIRDNLEAWFAAREVEVVE